MAEPVTIAVDVMGGDRGPAVVLRGALQALEADPDLRLTLVGPAEEVEPFAAVHDRATAQVATEVIEMGEHPAGAVRAKKDSSIVVGCRLVKEAPPTASSPPAPPAPAWPPPPSSSGASRA